MHLNFFPSHKGASLPMAVGLVAVLMAASAAAGQMISQSLHSVSTVEEAARAYGAAESGLETALYELAVHGGGYETSGRTLPIPFPNPLHPDERITDGSWRSEWNVASTDLSPCTAGVSVCGSLFPDHKITLPFSRDTSPTPQGVGAGVVPGGNIQSFIPTSFSLTLKLPEGGPAAFQVDNDGDAFSTDCNDLSGQRCLNEDGANLPDARRASCPGQLGKPTDDEDCDGRVDEDSAEDPVAYWKLSDNQGHSLTPKKGCLTGGTGSQLCERDFTNGSVTLNDTAIGLNESGAEQTLQAFFQLPDSGADTRRMQLEFFLVAPLKNVYTLDGTPAPQSHLLYDIALGDVERPPFPYFVIRSDGIFKNFKQSLTATVLPRAEVPLLDFAVIQR